MKIKIHIIVAGLILVCGCKDKSGDAEGETEGKAVEEKVGGTEESPFVEPDEVQEEPEMPSWMKKKELSAEKQVARCEQKEIAEACESAAEKYEQGDAVEKDQERAAELYGKAISIYETACSTEGKEFYCSKLALMYQMGKGTDRDPATAKKLMEKSRDAVVSKCEKEDADACCVAAFFYKDNEVLEPDLDEYREYRNMGYELAVKQCDDDVMEGCRTLSAMYGAGFCDVRVDKDKSTTYGEKVYKLGNAGSP